MPVLSLKNSSALATRKTRRDETRKREREESERKDEVIRETKESTARVLAEIVEPMIKELGSELRQHGLQAGLDVEKPEGEELSRHKIWFLELSASTKWTFYLVVEYSPNYGDASIRGFDPNGKLTTDRKLVWRDMTRNQFQDALNDLVEIAFLKLGPKPLFRKT